MDSVIGIDLSGLSRGTKGQTALAQLSLTHPPRLLDLMVLPRGRQTDPELIRWVSERKPRVVAIDAPLSLPHGLTCEDPTCPRCEPPSSSYLARDVDRRAGGMSTVMIAGIAFRGIYLARRMRRLGIEVIEVYPAAAYQRLGLRTKEERRYPARVSEVLAWHVPGALLGTADERDAVTAALVARWYAIGLGEVISGQDGAIWIPPATPGRR